MSALTDQNYIGNKYPTERKRCATSNYNLYTVNMSDWPYTLEVYQYLHLTPNLRLKLYLSFDPMYLTSAHSVSATGFYFRIRHPACSLTWYLHIWSVGCSTVLINHHKININFCFQYFFLLHWELEACSVKYRWASMIISSI